MESINFTKCRISSLKTFCQDFGQIEQHNLPHEASMD